MNYAVKCIQTGAIEFTGTYADCRSYIDNKKTSGNGHQYRIQAK
jgi:hypothetical protein